MPYLPTSQAFLEQSALLLEAYPETTRISTKYSFPTETPGHQHKRRKSQPTQDTSAPSSTTQPPTDRTPVACLTLKTFNPGTGITLKYRTNKGAEVSRLMTGLGKLAAGADVASLGVSGAGLAAAATGDVEMAEALAVDEGVAASPALSGAGTQGQTGKAAGGGGKGKKKGGKGKR